MEGFLLKKQYSEKICFFWSLYCKTLLATSWIGGFLFGILLWFRCDPQLFPAETVYSSFLTLLAASLLPIGLVLFIFSFSARFVCSLYIFIRTSLLGFSMMGLSMVLGRADWWTFFMMHGPFLSLEFGLTHYFCTVGSACHWTL